MAAPAKGGAPRWAWRWPAFVVALLAMTVAAHVVLVAEALGDPSFAVVDSYYTKAVHWDEHLAEEAANARLGWQVEVHSILKDSGQLLRLVLKDERGLPIAGASVQGRARHMARASVHFDLAFAAAADGTYTAFLPNSRAGLWELHVAVAQAGTHFTPTVRYEVEP